MQNAAGKRYHPLAKQRRNCLQMHGGERTRQTTKVPTLMRGTRS